MTDIKTLLDSKKKEDLQPIEAEEVKQNLIKPTDEEKLAIFEALRAGKTIMEVKKEIRRVEMGTREVEKDGKTVTEEYQVSAKGFTLEQIKEIDQAWKAKLAEVNAPAVYE